MDAAGCRTFFSGLFIMFVFDIFVNCYSVRPDLSRGALHTHLHALAMGLFGRIHLT